MSQLQAVIDALAPTLLIIALGAGLARRGFLGTGFIADLNRLAFYLCLPCLIFMSVAGTSIGMGEVLSPAAVLLGVTLLSCVLAGLWAYWRGLRGGALGAFMQAGFRGNLAFIGLPTLTYAFGGMGLPDRERLLGMAVLVMMPVMIFYNVLSVICLLGSRGVWRREDVLRLVTSIAKNPLIIALLLGLLVSQMGWGLPTFLDRAVRSVGMAAGPIALLCIGASMGTVGLGHRWRPALEAALCKVVLVPLLAWGGCVLLGLGQTDTFVVLLFASCPVAGASYIMAKQMGGDEVLAAGAIVLSTLLAVCPLMLVILWGVG